MKMQFNGEHLKRQRDQLKKASGNGHDTAKLGKLVNKMFVRELFNKTNINSMET
jgi:hypothetical protein